MSFNLSELFQKSRLQGRAEYVEKEKLKHGVLRAGSSGIISETGEVAGHCVRKAHLRSKGIELDPPTEDKLIMFDLGYASEDIIYKKLLTTLPEGQRVLREEEIPIEWLTSNGTKVTGRPDLVICEMSKELTDHTESDGTVVQVPMDTAKPVLGIELKSVHSVWVAREVIFNRKPKISNLTQAAHYMWKLGEQVPDPTVKGGAVATPKGLPYKLVYTNYSQLGQGMVGNDWILKMFPRPGDPGSEFVEYNDKGQIKHIRQFEVVYDLRFDKSGRLEFKLESEGQKKWTKTVVSIDGLESFYEYVSRMEEDQVLGPRPAQLDSLGGKAGYKDCTYCPLKEVCDSKEKAGYKPWLKAVTDHVGKK